MQNEVFGRKDRIGCAHGIPRGVTALAEVRLGGVLKVMVRETDGYFFAVYVGGANLIGCVIKVNKFGNTMAGLALNPQMRRMDFS